MCDNRIIPSDWTQDAMQRNALRVESISVSNCAERCILKPPNNWSEGAKRRSLNWLCSGGSPLVFGVCTRCEDRIESLKEKLLTAERNEDHRIAEKYRNQINLIKLERL